MIIMSFIPEKIKNITEKSLLEQNKLSYNKTNKIQQ